ncbi:MAG: hypothetical protein KF722_12940 [Nitrospira sp.]|nr:hypothetical protein [Nitrospira sp.]
MPAFRQSRRNVAHPADRPTITSVPPINSIGPAMTNERLAVQAKYAEKFLGAVPERQKPSNDTHQGIGLTGIDM